jgi:hypothetical protein
MNLMSLIMHSYVPELTQIDDKFNYNLSFTCDYINDTDHYTLNLQQRITLMKNAQHLADELGKLI